MIVLRDKAFAGMGGLLTMPMKNFKAAGSLWKAGGAMNKTKAVGAALGGTAKVGGAVAGVGLGVGGKYALDSKKALEGNMGNENGFGY